VRALIFDCDGVLGETESRGHRVAFNRTFREYGIAWSWSVEEYRRLLKIGGGKERLHALLETPEFQARFTGPEKGEIRDAMVREWHRRKSEIYRQIVEAGEIPARPGVRRLAEEALALGWRLAVASTSAESSVLAMMRHVFGEALAERFDVVIAGDAVSRKKPDPEIYRLCAQRLDIAPGNCVVVEDSAIGLTAACAAGMPCLVTVSEMTAGENFDGARRVVESLCEADDPRAVRVAELVQWGDTHE
jgi:HAD superfamily hydrolase (TIGR01509 family)